MPTYRYRCDGCGVTGDLQMVRSEARDDPWPCTRCDTGTLQRIFTPTANIFVHAHFRVLQSDVLPDKSDHAAWEARSSNSQYRPSEPKKPSLKDHLEQEFLSG